MIPVFDEVVTKINLDELSKTEEGKKYTDLLNKEIIFCNNNKDNIVAKALKTYQMCEANKKHEVKLIEACCNFKILETASIGYKSNIDDFNYLITPSIKLSSVLYAGKNINLSLSLFSSKNGLSNLA